jgi:hypothetical protein
MDPFKTIYVMVVRNALKHILQVFFILMKLILTGVWRMRWKTREEKNIVSKTHILSEKLIIRLSLNSYLEYTICMDACPIGKEAIRR